MSKVENSKQVQEHIDSLQEQIKILQEQAADLAIIRDKLPTPKYTSSHEYITNVVESIFDVNRIYSGKTTDDTYICTVELNERVIFKQPYLDKLSKIIFGKYGGFKFKVKAAWYDSHGDFKKFELYRTKLSLKSTFENGIKSYHKYQIDITDKELCNTIADRGTWTAYKV